MSQHTVTTPGENQEEPGPESPYSSQNLQVIQAWDPGKTSEHRQVKWYQANKETEGSDVYPGVDKERARSKDQKWA